MSFEKVKRPEGVTVTLCMIVKDEEKMRENGMKFWDEYCEYENLYSKLHLQR